MLVTFSSKEFENITMFGAIAKQLIILMGHSGTIPGALMANEIPAALARLQHEIQQRRTPLSPHQEEEETAAVSLAHRAIPLIGMLQAAINKQYNVMWKYY